LKKSINIFGWILTILLIVFGNPSAQSLSNPIYPSDEELFEAYLLGDIDYQTYLNLVEIFESGVDSTNQYLLEEIPDYHYFNQSLSDKEQSDKREQSEPFLQSDLSQKKKLYGSLAARHFQKLEEDGQTGNQFQLRSHFPGNWSFDGRFDGDHNGDYLAKHRAFIYQSKRGVVKKFIVGNFTARYGLGLTVGYRGRLLTKNPTDPGNSILFPNYGGFNGLYVQAGRYDDALRWLIHYDRNDTIQIRATAIDYLKRYKQFQGELILLGAILQNRQNDARYNQYQLGTYLQYKAESFRTAGEICWQNKGRAAIPAVLMETEYREGPVDLQLAGWRYDREFTNLFGGGRSGYYYNAISIDTIDFEYNDRRNGQQGFLFSGVSDISKNYKYSLSMMLYGRNRYETTGRLSTSLEKIINANSALKLSYLRQDRDELSGNILYHKVRVEYRRQGAKLFFRNYVGYNIDKEGHDFISYFVRVKGLVSGLGRVELWMNIDKINIDDKRVDYLYTFIREIVKARRNFELALKYSFRYNRSSSDREQSNFLIEAKWEW
jgi:hypothetical protein